VVAPGTRFKERVAVGGPTDAASPTAALAAAIPWQRVCLSIHRQHGRVICAAALSGRRASSSSLLGVIPDPLPAQRGRPGREDEGNKDSKPLTVTRSEVPATNCGGSSPAAVSRIWQSARSRRRGRRQVASRNRCGRRLSFIPPRVAGWAGLTSSRTRRRSHPRRRTTSRWNRSPSPRRRRRPGRRCTAWPRGRGPPAPDPGWPNESC